MTDPDRLRPLGWRPLLAAMVLGVVAGWLMKPIAEALSGHAPLLSWSQPIVYAVCAAGLGATAWGTRRSMRGTNRPLSPQVAVSRLVFARSAALVSALMVGFHLGSALAWVGATSEILAQRLTVTLVAALLSGAVLGSAIALERACRIKESPDGP